MVVEDDSFWDADPFETKLTAFSNSENIFGDDEDWTVTPTKPRTTSKSTEKTPQVGGVDENSKKSKKKKRKEKEIRCLQETHPLRMTMHQILTSTA
eukprot:TRINITY_DN4500_c0_g1_i1.p1 TRINITY_DN4500_c0_g1~~TRINITY_DN4500_c0_g1_i1.p1  ORF type:complete len:96 (-),score=24.67 TRINITY_DN4500_c0_g1_i1:24-311(-)